ncbi:MAG: 4Fe-4S dicluster domain-containing protein, partial [Eggerthellaceae bacterium]|nr:4Fe-4S dicluster domain-containing protein [Eggerthellaceae bacterium]
GLCAEVCPSGAIRMHEEGAVTVDPTRCIGCKYCYQACPFDIPRYRDKEKYGDAGMQKCSMCYERQNRWKTPGCVQSCPTGALVFGVYEDLVEEGRKRVAALKAAGYEKASLYGEKELGGLGVMYVLPLTRKNYGLPYLPKG